MSRRHRLIVAVFAIVAFVLLTAAISAFVPPSLGIDWRTTYRPAALAMLYGGNPYEAGVSEDAPFVAAPWSLIPLLPIALLPVEIGRSVVMLVAIVVIAYAAIRLGAKPLGMALVLLSPPVWFGIRQANIEWLPILGFALPPPVGLLLLATKPQTGFAVGVFWLFEALRTGGVHKAIRLCAPLTIAAAISFVMYGFWPSHLFAAQAVIKGSFNASFFPYSLPVGLVLLFTAIKSRRMEWAMGASPCLSPYVVFYSWGSAFLALVRKPQQLAIAVMATWLIAVVQAFVL